MSEPAWIIRTHRKTDAKRLGAFECATANVKWQLEVERFVRNKLHDWTTAPLGKTHSDARTILLVCRASRELVGVAAHERVRLSSPLSGEFDGTKIEVVAIVGRQLHGVRVHDGGGLGLGPACLEGGRSRRPSRPNVSPTPVMPGHGSGRLMPRLEART